MKKKSAKTAEAIEVATFKLAKGCSADDFLAANAEVDEWLKQQPGFRLPEDECALLGGI
jgi:hypothetical protein